MALPARKLNQSTSAHAVPALKIKTLTAEEWLSMLATMPEEERLKAYQRIEEVTKSLDGENRVLLLEKAKRIAHGAMTAIWEAADEAEDELRKQLKLARKPRKTKKRDAQLTTAVSYAASLHNHGFSWIVAAWIVNSTLGAQQGNVTYPTETYITLTKRFKKKKRLKSLSLDGFRNTRLFNILLEYQKGISIHLHRCQKAKEKEPTIDQALEAIITALKNKLARKERLLEGGGTD